MSSFAQFGPMYRRVQSCHIARDSQGAVEVLTEVRAAAGDLPKYVDDPHLLTFLRALTIKR